MSSYEKSNRAKRAVYKFIDWDEGGLFLGSTQGSIAKALSNFDVDDQLKSIEIWRKKTDIITGEDCREAIRSIIREERLTERVKKEVLDFYLEKVENDIYKSHKESGLADILIEIGDENFVPKLIESFETRDPQNLAQGMRTADILAGYKSNQVIEQLSSKAIDQKNSNLIREECSAALSKSKGNVSLSIFEKLLEDKSPKVRRNAVKGLDRFSSAEVKNLLLKHVNDERWVQYEAMKALGDKGLLVELMKTNKSPKRLYNVSVEILLEQIRKYKLREMLPVLDWLKDKVCEDDRRLIDIAHTYCVIEEKERAKEIIESFSHENELAVSQYGLADLAEISPNFDPPYSLRIIKEVFKSIDKLGDKSFFWEDKCVNSLERIGGKEALDILKDLAKRYAAQKHIVGIERTLRSINRLATNRDEGWYIKFIKSNPHLERSDLNRAIEGLGIVGSKKSIPVIMEIAALHRMEEYIPNACFLSIENIYGATGILTEITEKDIFKNKHGEHIEKMGTALHITAYTLRTFGTLLFLSSQCRIC